MWSGETLGKGLAVPRLAFLLQTMCKAGSCADRGPFVVSDIRRQRRETPWPFAACLASSLPELDGSVSHDGTIFLPFCLISVI